MFVMIQYPILHALLERTWKMKSRKRIASQRMYAESSHSYFYCSGSEEKWRNNNCQSLQEVFPDSVRIWYGIKAYLSKLVIEGNIEIEILRIDAL